MKQSSSTQHHMQLSRQQREDQGQDQQERKQEQEPGAPSEST
jgi:hypothetical protein